MNTPLSSFTALVRLNLDTAGFTAQIANLRQQLLGLGGKAVDVKLKYIKKDLNLPDIKQKFAPTLPKSAEKKTPQVSEVVRGKLLPLPAIKLMADTLSLKNVRLTNVPKIKLQASTLSLKEAKFTYIPKLRLEASTISLRNARYAYKGKIKSSDLPAIKQEVKLRYTGRLTSLPAISQIVNLVYRQGTPPPLPPQQGRTGGSGAGGTPNPWHMGTMAGGLGGLITRGNLAAVGAGAGLQQSFKQANFDIGQAPQFEFITGSAEKGAEQIAFVNKEVDRLSLNLFEANTMYRQLLASTNKNLGIEKTQQLFSSFQDIATMLSLSTDAQARGMRSFAQMASKGQVMS